MPERIVMPCVCGFVGSLIGFLFSLYHADLCLGLTVGGGTGGALGCVLCVWSCIVNPNSEKPLPIASVVGPSHEPVVVQNIHVLHTGDDKFPSKSDKTPDIKYID